MRFGVLSDIHANLAALRVAVARLRRIGVDGWLCAGDIVGYGPHPNECVETVAELDPLCVAGNHDLMVVGALDDRRAGQPARTSLAWTRDALHPEHRAFLAGLPRLAAGPGLVVAHGSLDDPQEYVRRPDRAAALLERLTTEHPQAGVLVLGHTHRSWLFSQTDGSLAGQHGLRRDVGLPVRAGDRVLLNPGAVGQSRTLEPQPRVRFAVLDLARPHVRLIAAPYDATPTRRALLDAGLDATSVHRRPRPVRNLVRRARDSLRTAAVPRHRGAP